MTKGKNLSLVFFFCVRADYLEAKLTPERDLSMFLNSSVFSGVVLISQGSPQMLFLKSSKHSHCFAFNETIFNAGWMA